MNSFILHFRAWGVALLALIILEAGYLYLRQPARLERTNFLEYRFANEESVQRLFLHEKLKYFADSAPDIIQVGDSSGLHGMIPHVIMSHLPSYKYVNLSAANNVGYDGFYYLAQFMLERNKTIKYLVLYNTPVGGLPRSVLWKKPDLMGGDIHREFLDPFQTAFQLPSLAARRSVTDSLYYMNGTLKSRRAPLTSNIGYLMFDAIFRPAYGWARETDNADDIQPSIKAYMGAQIPQWMNGGVRLNPESFYDWRSMSQTTLYDVIYSEFAKLARKHRVKLVVIFNPVPVSIKDMPKELFDEQAVMAAIDQVRTKHPDVFFPSQMEYWPDEKFSVFSHIATPHAVQSSERGGEILKRVVGNTPAPPREAGFLSQDAPTFVDLPFSRPFCGYHWLPAETNASRQWWRYIGPQHRSYVHTVVKPGADYTLRAYIHTAASQAIVDGLALSVFDQSVARARSGFEAPYPYIEWDIAQSLIDRYQGWLEIRFDVPKHDRASSDEKKIAFSRIVLRRK